MTPWISSCAAKRSVPRCSPPSAMPCLRETIHTCKSPCASSLPCACRSPRRRLRARGAPAGGREAHERQLADWTARKERLEGDPARQIPEMNLERRLRETGRRVVAALMLRGTALAEFVKFYVFDFTAKAERLSESEWRPAQCQPPRYLAFILLAGDPDNCA